VRKQRDAVAALDQSVHELRDDPLDPAVERRRHR
jgi:hypothetical protein